MKVSDFIYDYQHAKNYVQGSILFLNDVPIWIQIVEPSVSGRFKFIYRVLGPNERVHRKICTSKTKLEMKPIKFGFVNYFDKIVKVSRKPSRVWKLGPGIDSLQISPLVHIQELLFSPGFLDTINGTFPPIGRYPKTVAFSRYYYINPDGYIFYIRSNDTVGRFVDGCIRLNDNRKFLKEHLSDITGLPCF